MDKKSVPKRTPPKIIRRFSIMPHGLREKLIVAFSLMSVLPLLVMGYILSNYVFPKLSTTGEISIIAGIAIGIALLGFIVARSLVFPVIRMASEAQAIAAGNLEQEVEVEETSELGDLGKALNQMSQKVRENMAQLKVYGEQAMVLNLEINQKVLALSHVLQASNLITQSAKLEEIHSFILEKLSQMDGAELNCILQPVEGDEGVFMIQAAAGADQTWVDLLLHKEVVAPWLANALRERRLLVIDDNRGSSVEKDFLDSLFGMHNAVCQPLTSMGKPVALLVSANQKQGYTFDEDTMNLLKVFSRQTAIAIENNFLAKRAAVLETTDELTGLYNARHMKARLEEEVLRAVRFHHSCSLLVFHLENLDKIRHLYGPPAGDEVLRQVAELLRKNLTEVDRAGRTGPNEFTLILPEKNKREAFELAENIRQQIERNTFSYGAKRLSNSLTVLAGVSENPLDGASGMELLAKATRALQSAKR